MSAGVVRLVAVISVLLNPIGHARAIWAAAVLSRRLFRMAFLMARRDLSSRYAGQFLGALWNVLHPLFLMLVFLFIFGVVFKQRIGGTYELPGDYTIYILSGLVPWLSIVPVFVATSVSIVNNSTLIKQFDFEPEILPIKEVMLSAVFWITGLVIILGYQLFKYQAIPWTYLLLPAVLILHFGTLLGLGWALAALSVFVRDVKDIMTLVTVVGVYILPIIYLPSWIPRIFAPVIYANPFSYLIWCYQDVLYFGRIEHPEAWGIAFAIMLMSLSLGFRVFRRLKPVFGNAL